MVNFSGKIWPIWSPGGVHQVNHQVQTGKMKKKQSYTKHSIWHELANVHPDWGRVTISGLQNCCCFCPRSGALPGRLQALSFAMKHLSRTTSGHLLNFDCSDFLTSQMDCKKKIHQFVQDDAATGANLLVFLLIVFISLAHNSLIILFPSICSFLRLWTTTTTILWWLWTICNKCTCQKRRNVKIWVASALS